MSHSPKLSIVLFAIMLAGHTVVLQAEEPRLMDLIFPTVQLAEPNPIDTETYRNCVIKAYVQALQDGKYTLVLFSKHHRINPFAKRLAERLSDPSLAKYSDRVVFCLTDPGLDEGGAARRSVGGQRLSHSRGVENQP